MSAIIIATDEENDRMLGIVESLMAKGEDNLSPRRMRCSTCLSI